MFRRVASQIAEILKGTRLGEIPFYQPTRFDLMINLKTAKALGAHLPFEGIAFPVKARIQRTRYLRMAGGGVCRGCCGRQSLPVARRRTEEIPAVVVP
jgi:hypothetical protein